MIEQIFPQFTSKIWDGFQSHIEKDDVLIDDVLVVPDSVNSSVYSES